jgi:hypothetical protein
MSFNTKIIHDIIFILDESGSMDIMGGEPVQAVNSFIDEQKKSLGDDGATFSLWKFNTKVTKVIDDQDLQTVEKFTDFHPDNMTALYDAIGKAITTKKQKNKYDNVICVILTDGQENCSREFRGPVIRNMISEMEEKHNWTFVYLGANQDAFAVGGGIGVSKNCCAQYECTPGKLSILARQTSAAVSCYRTASVQGIDTKLDLTAPVQTGRSSSLVTSTAGLLLPTVLKRS